MIDLPTIQSFRPITKAKGSTSLRSASLQSVGCDLGEKAVQYWGWEGKNGLLKGGRADSRAARGGGADAASAGGKTGRVRPRGFQMGVRSFP